MSDTFYPWTPNRQDLEALETDEIARAILGTLLVCETGGVLTAGVIVEAEAYLGVVDRACHTYKGRKTPRLETLWMGPGRAYVYTIHQQWLLNVTTRPEGDPQCVLIRALWPAIGIETMATRRKIVFDTTSPRLRDLVRLTSGPGRLCSAMGIDRSHNGLDLLDPNSLLRLEAAPPGMLRAAGIDQTTRICRGPRIGVQSAGEDASLPLRFWFDGNPFVSK